MDKQSYYRLVSLVFTLLAIGHGIRLFYGWPAQLGEIDVPLEVSWVMLGIAGYLAIRGWQFASGKVKSKR